MSTAIISFPTGPHRSGHGFPLPMGSSVPVMRPRMSMTATEIVSELDEALEELAETPCGFWACEGPRRPRAMVTCRKCWTMRSLARLRATIAAKTNATSKGQRK